MGIPGFCVEVAKLVFQTTLNNNECISTPTDTGARTFHHTQWAVVLEVP